VCVCRLWECVVKSVCAPPGANVDNVALVVPVVVPSEVFNRVSPTVGSRTMAFLVVPSCVCKCVNKWFVCLRVCDMLWVGMNMQLNIV